MPSAASVTALRTPAAVKPAARPFIKWVGGKSQLLHELMTRAPVSYTRYFEPFLGGGAFFFASQPPRAVLSDVNPELINAYTVVRDSCEDLIADLQRHVYDSAYFYKIRDVDRAPEYVEWTPVQRAGRFVYLNKTCFNGLYRVNSKGHFNTPFGRYANPTIVNPENLRACSAALQGVDIRVLSFAAAAESAAKGDFVYFDPPYVPLSATAYFTSYSTDGFGLAMQEQLFETCCKLDRSGVRFMLSNSSAPWVTERYKQFEVALVSARRAINSKGDRRGEVKEVIVTNY